LNRFLESLGPYVPAELRGLAAFAILLIAALLANFIAKHIILRGLAYIVQRSKNKWDDIFLEKKVFNRLSQLAPALVFYLAADWVFPSYAALVRRLALAFMMIVGVRFLDALLNALHGIYQGFNVAAERPIKGYIQAVKIILLLVCTIMVTAVLIDQSPVLLFSGLGAMTAIILLIFRDTILGFVAGIQLASNNMIRQGDWVTVPSAGADGDVVDVSLTTVKVQNWDKTITSIPIYSLVAGSFTNWRGMSESGGRRIKRAINIDIGSIRFCDEAMLDRFEKIDKIADYLRKRRAEIGALRQERHITEPINGPRLTNVGVFRKYIAAYLRDHPLLHSQMTSLVRQLAATDIGLPLEIYIFSKDQRWEYYEDFQSDIFDHLVAVAPEFELAVFQRPSGRDIRQLLTVWNQGQRG